MLSRKQNRQSQASDLFPLLRASFEQKGLEAISHMLEHIAYDLDAYGIVLWRLRDSRTRDPKKTWLYMRATYFKVEIEGKSTFYGLPLYDSVTGSAVAVGKLRFSNKVRRARLPCGYRRFIEELNVAREIACPVSFNDGRLGALTAYRKEDDPAFDREVAKRISEYGSVLPHLYDAIRERVTLQLVSQTDTVLSQEAPGIADARTCEKPNDRYLSEIVNDAYTQVCDVVSSTFNSAEVSVFLEDPFGRPGEYGLVATTWKDSFPKSSYHKDPRDGCTGWVLSHCDNLIIPDWGSFEQHRDVILDEYPELNWTDPLGICGAMRLRLGLREQDPLPAISLMSVPIRSGKEAIGVIRCTGSGNIPHYFGSPDIVLLERVASRIGQHWLALVGSITMEIEYRSLQALVDVVSELNALVQRELPDDLPTETRILKKAVRLTEEMIGSAYIVDVSLWDQTRQRFSFVETYCDEPSRKAEKIAKKLSKLLRSSASAEKTGRLKVLQTRAAQVVEDVPTNSDCVPLNSKVKRMIRIPITVSGRDHASGILTIHGASESSFPTHVKSMAELIAGQLGLYHYLLQTVRNLKRTDGKLRSQIEIRGAEQREETHRYEDLTHQLKGPAALAKLLADTMVETLPRSSKYFNKMSRIRGVCRRTKCTSLSLRLLSEVGRGKPIEVSLSPLDITELLRMLILAAEDTEMSISPSRRIKVTVDRSSFEYCPDLDYETDLEVLEHATNCILDNAAKYSYSNTTIRISGGFSKKGHFYVSVESKGIRIKPHEVGKCVVRGYQGEEAQRFKSGSGIGLYLVDNVMRALNGRLDITPTKQDHVTVVRLMFFKGK